MKLHKMKLHKKTLLIDSYFFTSYPQTAHSSLALVGNHRGSVKHALNKRAGKVIESLVCYGSGQEPRRRSLIP